jgi:hypothetical protein
MKRMIFVALIFVVMSTVVYAWEDMGYATDSDKVKVFQSWLGNTRKTTEGTVVIEIKDVYTEEGRKREKEYPANFSYTICQIEINCASSERRYLQWFLYDAQGNVLKEIETTKKWLATYDTTMAGIFYKRACGKLAQPKPVNPSK